MEKLSSLGVRATFLNIQGTSCNSFEFEDDGDEGGKVYVAFLNDILLACTRIIVHLSMVCLTRKSVLSWDVSSQIDIPVSLLIFILSFCMLSINNIIFFVIRLY